VSDKESVFLPLAFQYDPNNLSSLQESFGVSENELLAFMKEVAKWVRDDRDEESENTAFVQKTLIPMFQRNEVSGNMIMFLASHGATTLWEKFCDGMLLHLDAEIEERNKGVIS
jgi:hypothetical protein